VNSRQVSIARRVAFEALLEVFGQPDAKADEILDSSIKKHNLTPRDAALAFQLCYGVLRNLTLLDYYIEPFLTKSLTRTPAPIATILRLGFYQKAFLERVPDYAIVNESVNLARSKVGDKHAQLVNAVLRNFLRQNELRALPDPAKDVFHYYRVKYSFPQWIIEIVKDVMSETRIEPFLEKSNTPAPLDLRINTMKADRATVCRMLRESGLREIEETPYSSAGVRIGEQSIHALRQSGILDRGFATVQDEAAQLVSFILEPRRDERIIDYCAAPGGKTTHIAEITRDRARIFALDVNPARLALVKNNAQRLGINSIETHRLDGAVYAKLKESKADRLLVDAPCSSLGVIRRHPEIRWLKEKTDIARLAALQLEICTRALELLKPGGIFLYSVCTFTRAETRDMVENLLHLFPQLELQSMRQSLRSGLDALITDEGFFQTFPHIHGTDGFFAARFRLTRSIS